MQQFILHINCRIMSNVLVLLVERVVEMYLMMLQVLCIIHFYHQHVCIMKYTVFAIKPIVMYNNIEGDG